MIGMNYKVCPGCNSTAWINHPILPGVKICMACHAVFGRVPETVYRQLIKWDDWNKGGMIRTRTETRYFDFQFAYHTDPSIDFRAHGWQEIDTLQVVQVG
jgi:hypothetical protein